MKPKLLLAGTLCCALALGACDQTGSAQPITLASIAAKIQKGLALLPEEVSTGCDVLAAMVDIAAPADINAGTVVGKAVTGAGTLLSSPACTSTGSNAVTVSAQLAAAAKAIAAATSGKVTPTVAVNAAP
jgi:hypothetical protein